MQEMTLSPRDNISIVRISEDNLYQMEEVCLMAKKIFTDTFSFAYQDNKDYDLYVEKTFQVHSFIKEWEKADQRMWTIEHADQVAGYLMLSSEAFSKGHNHSYPLEIKRFYLDKPFHGKGIAQKMMTFCLEEARKILAPYVFLGVWPSNHRAIKFYQKYDFKVDGEIPFQLGEIIEMDWRMKKDLR
ncbi:MAG: GNAT family N-acetyltransferase [Bacteroidota bacterium]